ncbi:MAG: DNA-binding protein [Clostridiales bacterium 43-6]|nr:MAG: DNA-binding protein [Clostridiales bacterium 43-6]
MKYISTKVAAEKWGISVRRVTLLCNQGRIKAAYKIGTAWAIPGNAEKPIDPRKSK